MTHVPKPHRALVDRQIEELAVAKKKAEAVRYNSALWLSTL
jgi:hypothetical protein